MEDIDYKVFKQSNLTELVIDYLNDRSKNEKELFYEIEIKIEYKKRVIVRKGLMGLCKFYHQYFDNRFPAKLKSICVDADEFNLDYILLILWESMDKFYYHKNRANMDFIEYFYSSLKNRFIDIFRIMHTDYYKKITGFVTLDKEEFEEIRSMLLTYDTYFNDDKSEIVTDRQHTIIKMMQQHYTQNEISANLNVSNKTISRDLKKLNKYDVDDIIIDYQDTKDIYNIIKNEIEVKSKENEECEKMEMERNALIKKSTEKGYNADLKTILKEFDTKNGVKMYKWTATQMYFDYLNLFSLL